MMKKLLTINIATLPDREQKFVKKMISIAPKWCEVNIDSSIGNLGDKRNEMVKKSTGKYVCVVDDDDDISEDYFDEILIGIKKDVDVVCISVEKTKDGVYDCTYHYGRFNPNSTQNLIGHFCPVKREHILQAGYRSIGYGEDFDMSTGLIDILKTAHYISKPLYFQKFITREKEYNLYTDAMDYMPRLLSGKLPLV